MKNSIAAIQQTRNLLLISILIFSTMANAQWTQMGPGAGGQERALYIYHKSTTDNDVYVGSDVSGVWRAPAISDADLNNPNSYNYTYISNHRIFRFMNKFYRADEGTNNYLFCLNRGGIDRIELDNAGNMTAVQVLTNGLPITGLANSWVSDMHVTASNGQTYFITGNTRTSDPGPGNNKANNVQDIYMGNILAGYNTITVTKRKSLYMLPDGQDVYCLYVDDNNNSNASDDLIFIGAQNGLHIFTQPLLATGPNNNPLPQQTKMADPTNVTFLDYRLTSLRLISKVGADYTFLATINGLDDGTGFGGLYTVIYHGNNTVTWQKYSTTLIGDNQNATPTTAQYDNPHFNQTLEVPGGYLVFNETNLEHLPLVTDPNYFVGAFYFPASSGIPTGASTVLTTWGTGNDWGWNNSKPCSNINGCTITNNGLLLVGKSGNIFASKAPVSGATVDWQQIYTTETALTSCIGEFEYANHGYVNTANKTVYPQTEDDVWLGQADRLIWNSTNGASTFTEVKLNNNINTPCIYEIDTTNVQNLGLPIEVEGREYNFSDCFFVAENNADPNDNFLYASMSSGFASNIGRGAVVRRQKNDPVSTRWVPYGSNLLAGDASKMLFDNKGNHFLLVNQIQTVGPVLKKLYWLNTNNLWEETNMNLAPATQVVDAVMAPDGDKLFLILDVNGTKTFEVWTGSNNVWMVSCSNTVGNNTALIPKILTMMPYGANNQYYKILCGTAPNSLTVLDNNLYEVYDSQHPTLCAGTSVTSTLPDIFIKLNNDLLDNTDEGVTAIGVNASTHTIYAATVHFDNTLTPQVKSHLYAGTYNFYDGIINTGSWTDITGTLPNKTLTSLNTHGSDGCNAYLFGCLRGLGPWKLDLPAPTTFNQNYFDNNPTITGTGSITENIVINAITNINAANINIEAGYTITVNGGTLNIDNGSHLYSCGDMWQGIINNGGTVNIINSTIEDAIIALDTKNSGQFTLENSTFDHNYITLKVQNGDYVNMLTGIITGCSFKCTGGQITKAPHANQLSRYHIFGIDLQNLTVGDASNILLQNNFGPATFGIYALTENLTVINNKFEGTFAATNFEKAQTAIYTNTNFEGDVMQKLNGIVIGGSGLEINTFNDYQNGVVMYNTGEPIVKENTFTKCLQAVEAVSCGYALALGTGNANFNDNNFNNCIFGIYCRESQGTPKIVLNKFNINQQYNIDEYGLEAIRVENIMQDAFPIVQWNEINNMAIAIHLRNAIKAQVRWNNCTTQITNVDLAALNLPNLGIWIENCTNSSIIENTVERLGTDISGDAEKDLMQGINMDISTNCVLHLNNTLNMGTDINVIADCNPATISCNNMTSSNRGINFDNASIVTGNNYYDNSTASDNTWNGDYLTNGNLRISGGFNGGFPLDWYHQGAFAANNMFCPFNNSGAVAPQEFASSNGCPESSPDNSALKSAQNAALNLAQYGEFITQNRYADDASAFSILLNDSNMRDSLKNLYGYIDNWYNYLSTANIGKFEEIQKLLAANNKQAAINKANTLITSSVIYQNLKTLSLLFANNLISTDSIPTDSSVVYVLNTIADQDPTIGGKAVWIARAILRKDIFAFSNNLNRVKNEIKVNSAIETADVSIKPNPANKEITVSSNSIIKEIVIEDMQGMRVKQLQLTENANSIEINISNLTSGVYVVKCHFENEKYLFTKLVITK